MVEAFNIIQDRIARSRLAGDPPDVMIGPKLGRIGLFDSIAPARRSTSATRPAPQAWPTEIKRRSIASDCALRPARSGGGDVGPHLLGFALDLLDPRLDHVADRDDAGEPAARRRPADGGSARGSSGAITSLMVSPSMQVTTSRVMIDDDRLGEHRGAVLAPGPGRCRAPRRCRRCGRVLDDDEGADLASRRARRRRRRANFSAPMVATSRPFWARIDGDDHASSSSIGRRSPPLGRIAAWADRCRDAPPPCTDMTTMRRSRPD